MTFHPLRFGRSLIALLIAGVVVQTARAEDTVGGLLRDPKRLDAVQHGCKVNAPWATEALCKTASEAIRRRFRGDGVPYTPHPVDAFPSQSNPKPGPPSASKSEVHHRSAPSHPSIGS